MEHDLLPSGAPAHVFNTILVNGLILATAPLMAVLMLGELGFAPWQYGLAFGAPCVGGLVGSRLARRLVARFGQRRVMRVAGTLRACWSVGLAFAAPGAAGLALILAVQCGLVMLPRGAGAPEGHRVARIRRSKPAAHGRPPDAMSSSWSSAGSRTVMSSRSGGSSGK